MTIIDALCNITMTSGAIIILAMSDPSPGGLVGVCLVLVGVTIHAGQVLVREIRK